MTAPLRTIRDAWASYRTAVLRGDAPPVQIVETRRAFYAGAQALLGIILANLTPGAEPSEADFEMMDKLHSELLAFGGDVKEGRA